VKLTFLLKNCRLFADLDTAELALIEQTAARREFRKGEFIFREGEPAHGFFLVVSGVVKVFRSTTDGRERVLHVVEAGDSFAEAALFMLEYPATAEALAATTVIAVNKNRFKQLLARDTKLSFKIMGALVKWLAQMRNALTDLTTKEAPARFASYALDLPEPKIVPINKMTLAQTLGMTKETFSRLLHRLAKARILTYRSHQIKILDCPRLAAIARGDEKI
jgi:CRP-like cAMP-binding protein